MLGRSWLCGPLLAGALLVACGPDSPVGSSDGGEAGNAGGGPPLNPATFTASVNPTLPPGYSVLDEAPYRWQAYVYFDGDWVAVGHPRLTEAPSVRLVIDCNDPGIHNACTVHRSAMIQVTVTRVSPGSALLCGYKSGFQILDDFLLSTPIGPLSLAPVASSSQDPANQGTCFP